MLNDKSNFVRYALALLNIATHVFHLLWKFKLMSHCHISVLAGSPIKSSGLTVFIDKSKWLIMAHNSLKQ